MTLTESMTELIRACFSGIWIESQEQAEAITELAAMCRQEDWHLSLWDVEQGLRTTDGTPAAEDSGDPLAAVRSFSTATADGGTSLLVLQNFHRFLSSPEVIQAVHRAVLSGKTTRCILVVIAPVVELPVELEKLFVVTEHTRPDRLQLETIARGIATETDELPEASELEQVLDASSGLTRQEAENAFSLSLVRHGRLRPPAIWEIKTQTLKKTGLLSLYRGGEDFSSLGGLSSLKAFTKRALLRRSGGTEVQPKGVMLLSPPGCGKSAFCKALGKEVGRPVLMLDVGSLMGSLVGQSEERTRQALATIDAMAPAIVMIDEVEKAFAGASGGQNDSGVTARLFGTFLSWLNDHESDVFVVCTANDVSRLPPEFSRSERFDAVFFVDLPSRKEKDAIWQIYRTRFGIEAEQPIPGDSDWTGAEIRSCCRLAALLDLPLTQAAQHIVPVAVTARESVTQLRSWAEGRCLCANKPGVFRSSKTRRRRSVASAEPSTN